MIGADYQGISTQRTPEFEALISSGYLFDHFLHINIEERWADW
jgi:hypothetical protein